MNNKEFGKRLEARTEEFAVRIVRLSASLPATAENVVIKNQVTKSGTSIGANYHEANCSRSRQDFLNKIKICQGETRETMYWLGVIIDLQITGPGMAEPLIEEAKEMFALFSAIIRKIKQNPVH